MEISLNKTKENRKKFKGMTLREIATELKSGFFYNDSSSRICVVSKKRVDAENLIFLGLSEKYMGIGEYMIDEIKQWRDGNSLKGLSFRGKGYTKSRLARRPVYLADVMASAILELGEASTKKAPSISGTASFCSASYEWDQIKFLDNPKKRKKGRR